MTLKQTKGFTLIELLIVITIIGILAALVLVNLQGVRERARDARRKSDLNSIKTALRLYYNDFRGFPGDSSGQIAGCGVTGTSVCAWGSAFASSTNTYMNSLPLDPISSSSNTVTYTYVQTSSDSYTLTAELENASDPDIADSHSRCGTGSGTEYVICE